VYDTSRRKFPISTLFLQVKHTLLITEINNITERLTTIADCTHGTSIYLLLLTLRKVHDFIMTFLKSSIFHAAFLLLYLVGNTAGGKLKSNIIGHLLWLLV